MEIAERVLLARRYCCPGLYAPPAADFDLFIIKSSHDNSGDELPAADFDLVCFCMGVMSLN